MKINESTDTILLNYENPINYQKVKLVRRSILKTYTHFLCNEADEIITPFFSYIEYRDDTAIPCFLVKDTINPLYGITGNLIFLINFEGNISTNARVDIADDKVFDTPKNSLTDEEYQKWKKGVIENLYASFYHKHYNLADNLMDEFENNLSL